MANCEHLEAANRETRPSGITCMLCAALGQRPVELRVCLTCGHVGCCDSSPGRHATNHFHETGHPMMRPLHGGNWLWCYEHQTYLEFEKPDHAVSRVFGPVCVVCKTVTDFVSRRFSSH
jgi:hypothetical protein